MTLTSIINLGHSGPGSNDMKAYSSIQKAPKLELHHHMAKYYIQDTRWRVERVLLLCGGAVCIFHSSCRQGSIEIV